MEHKQRQIENMGLSELTQLKMFQDNRDEIIGKAIKEAVIKQHKQEQSEIDKVTFRVHYNAVFGQNVYITGAGRLFGNWDAENKGIKLKWSQCKYKIKLLFCFDC